MNKSVLLGSALALAVAGTPVMAENDFHALGQVGSVAPMADEQLNAVEGGGDKTCSGIGNTCLNVAVVTQVGGPQIGVGKKVYQKQENEAYVYQNIGN